MAADRRNLRPNLKETKNVQHFYEPIESLSHTYTAHLRIVEVTVDHGHWDLCQHDGVGEGEGEDQEIGRLAEERGPGKKRKGVVCSLKSKNIQQSKQGEVRSERERGKGLMEKKAREEDEAWKVVRKK